MFAIRGHFLSHLRSFIVRESQEGDGFRLRRMSSYAVRRTTGTGGQGARFAGVTWGSVWFSDKGVGLGVPLLRAIDKGVGELVSRDRAGDTALLRRLPTEGIADQRLSALLARERLVPIVHETTCEALHEVSRCWARVLQKI